MVFATFTPRSGLLSSITKSLASRHRFQYKGPDKRMKDERTSSSRRGSIVIQTMLARLVKEEEEYRQQQSEESVGRAATPKTLAARS